MYELTPLFWYKIQFMTELILAEALVFSYCKRKKNFIPRMIIALIGCYAFAFLVPIIAYNAIYSIFLFLALASFTILGLKFCFNEEVFTIFFLVISAYAVQHIAHQVCEFLITITGVNSDAPLDSYNNFAGGSDFNPFTTLIYGVSYIFVYNMSFMIIVWRYLRNFKNLKVKQMSLLIIAIFIFLFAIILSLVITYFSYETYVLEYIIVVYIYDIFSCILALFIQYDMALRERLEINYNTVNHLYRQEQEQFVIMKENINMINLKCHDLKHQVRAIGKQSMLSSEAIKEIESVINIYDSAVKTGNEALDIILTDKSLLCGKKDIRLSCMIDGKKMAFMNESDIYSLFGNLVDNAIESVVEL